MEQISKMATEVNKLIGGKLLAGKSIYLPEIGSLYISMSSTQRKRVEFSSAQQGESIVDVIVARAKCSDEDGLKIYTHYIKEVKEGSRLSILGVGTLNAKSFATDEAFAKHLNTEPEPVAAPVKTPAPTAEPTQVVEPVVAPIAPIKKVLVAKVAPSAPKAEPKVEPKVEPKAEPKVEPKAEPKAELKKNPKPVATDKPEKGNGAKRIIIAIAAAIVIAAGGYYLYNYIAERNAEAARIEAQEVARVKEAQRLADSIRLAEQEARKAAESAVVVEQVAPYRVVYGVFRDKRNADRALVTINKRFGEGSARALDFAGYTLVSMYESESRAACQNFLMANYDEFPDSWVYESK